MVVRVVETEHAAQRDQGRGGPPVEVAEEAHRGGHEKDPHERRVDSDGERHPEPDRLHQDDARDRESPEDRDHDRRRTRDHPRRPGDAVRWQPSPVRPLPAPDLDRRLTIVPLSGLAPEDVVTDGGIASLVLANAPLTEDGFFLVPKVVE